jgi:Flp pilus assembly protein TadD
MPGDRDLGLQSLQSGDVAGAIQQLEAACASNGSDYMAHIYLGAAYSQANRTMDAIRVLTRSVELQPANAQGRYNLGLAMERGGFTDQAATAYEQAIQLQPDYPKAQEALQEVLRRRKTDPVLRNDALTDRALLVLDNGRRSLNPRDWLRGRPAELETFEVIRKDVDERRLWEQEWENLDGK